MLSKYISKKTQFSKNVTQTNVYAYLVIFRMGAFRKKGGRGRNFYITFIQINVCSLVKSPTLSNFFIKLISCIIFTSWFKWCDFHYDRKQKNKYVFVFGGFPLNIYFSGNYSKSTNQFWKQNAVAINVDVCDATTWGILFVDGIILICLTWYKCINAANPARLIMLELTVRPIFLCWIIQCSQIYCTFLTRVPSFID